MTRSLRTLIGATTVALVLALTACSAGPVGDAGPQGPAGEQGSQGPAGTQGEQGIPGEQGPAGSAGIQGADGVRGAIGRAGTTGTTGATGAVGPAGAQGAPGPQGAQGEIGAGDAALFFAIMPPDNAATVAVGADVEFPQDGPSTGAGAVRSGPSAFMLTTPGVYRVAFNVAVTDPGQLILTLDGVDLAYTVTGRAIGSSLIGLTTLVETTSPNQVLTVRNPAGNSNALTITPIAGGSRAVSATLLIELVKAS